MKLISIIFALMTVVPSAQAHEVRNGGSAIVCRNLFGKITSVELFDYWEMKQVLGTTQAVDLGPDTLPVADKIEIFMKRIETIDAARATQYRDYATAVLSQLNQEIQDGLGNKPIDDDGTQIQNSPWGCEKELFAEQIRDPAPGETRFKIRKEIYENPLTSNTTRAGILLHEIIYRDAIESGAANSLGARKFNYGIAANYQNVTSQNASCFAFLKACRLNLLGYPDSLGVYSPNLSYL